MAGSVVFLRNNRGTNITWWYIVHSALTKLLRICMKKWTTDSSEEIFAWTVQWIPLCTQDFCKINQLIKVESTEPNTTKTTTHKAWNTFANYPSWECKPYEMSQSQHNGTLQWRHNGRDCASNHQLHHCLLNPVFRRRSKKASKLRVTGLCVGNSMVTGESPA